MLRRPSALRDQRGAWTGFPLVAGQRIIANTSSASASVIFMTLAEVPTVFLEAETPSRWRV
ncbi:MAG: hypothetical protein WCF85_22295, partial [Rhodospirillaceae bacterium]